MSCRKYMRILARVAEGIEPDDQQLAEEARTHALLCSACFDRFFMACGKAQGPVDSGISDRVAAVLDRPIKVISLDEYREQKRWEAQVARKALCERIAALDRDPPAGKRKASNGGSQIVESLDSRLSEGNLDDFRTGDVGNSQLDLLLEIPTVSPSGTLRARLLAPSSSGCTPCLRLFAGEVVIDIVQEDECAGIEVPGFLPPMACGWVCLRPEDYAVRFLPLASVLDGRAP